MLSPTTESQELLSAGTDPKPSPERRVFYPWSGFGCGGGLADRVVSSEECSDYLGAGKVFAGGEGIGGCGVCPGLFPWGFACLGLPGIGMGAGLMPPVFGRPAGIMELTIYGNCC